MTKWVCHIHFHLFENYRRVVVRYYATFNGTGRGCFAHRELQGTHGHLLTLIFTHNEFTGSEWQYTESSVIGLDTHGPVRELPSELFLEIYTPSAHERAEALLSLSDWLDGKVSEEEKRKLLQLPEPTEV